MALEAAMADMMKDVQGVLDTANETKAELNKVRRKSRELEDSLGDMAEASDAWNKLGTLSKDDAKKKYVKLVDKLAPTWREHKRAKL